MFIGLENINPKSLMGAKKRQNKIWEYREMLQQWRKQRVITFAGYILGFPTDTPETIARDIEIIKKELPIDILEFTCLTPLPGSEDHKVLHMKGVPMDPDLNNYDSEHPCTAHPLMSKETWEKVYMDAWHRYYSPEHVETIMRRGEVSGINRTKLFDMLTIFFGAPIIEDVHGLQFGFIRRKVRTQRRYGMPIVNPLIFYPWRVYDFVSGGLRWLKLLRRNRRIQRRVLADPTVKSYTDEALTPITGGRGRPFRRGFRRQDPENPRRPGRAGPRSGRRGLIAKSRAPNALTADFPVQPWLSGSCGTATIHVKCRLGRAEGRPGDCAADISGRGHGKPQIQGLPDQAVALRPRRLRHPVVPLLHPVQQPGQRLRAARGVRRTTRCLAPTSTSRSTPVTSATPSSTSSASPERSSEAGGGFVGLVGVQSNQFPRAIDIGREFRADRRSGRASAASTRRAASRCCPTCRPT